MKIGGGKNAFVKYNLENNLYFNLKDSEMLVNIHDKKHKDCWIKHYF